MSKKPLRIVEYRIDYTHKVQVGVPSESDQEALDTAQAAFDAGRIWDDTPEMPLLYDDYDEVEGETLAFQVVDVVDTVEAWPEPAVCVLNARREAAAREACRLLMLAEALRGASGEYQRTLDQAYRMASQAFGGPEIQGAPRPPRVVVGVEGGLVQGASSDLPVELVVFDYDVDECDGAVAVPQSGGGETQAAVIDHCVALDPTFIDEAWRVLSPG